jgi:hypothetical protein
MTPRQRATWARKLVTGEKRVSQLTRKQASTICGVSVPLIDRAANGESIPSSFLLPQHCVSWWQQASVSDRVDFVRACGVSEVWDALTVVID